jgi:hypothetical protein
MLTNLGPHGRSLGGTGEILHVTRQSYGQVSRILRINVRDKPFTNTEIHFRYCRQMQGWSKVGSRTELRFHHYQCSLCHRPFPALFSPPPPFNASSGRSPTSDPGVEINVSWHSDERRLLRFASKSSRIFFARGVICHGPHHFLNGASYNSPYRTRGGWTGKVFILNSERSI